MTAIACDPGRERQGDEYSSPFSLLDPQCLCPDQISADDHCQRRVGGGVLIVGGIDHELSPVCPAVVGGVLRHVCEVAVLETEQRSVFDSHMEHRGIMVHAPAVPVEQGDFELVDRIAVADGSCDDIARFFVQCVFLYVHLARRHSRVQAVTDSCVIFRTPCCQGSWLKPDGCENAVLVRVFLKSAETLVVQQELDGS